MPEESENSSDEESEDSSEEETGEKESGDSEAESDSSKAAKSSEEDSEEEEEDSGEEVSDSEEEDSSDEDSDEEEVAPVTNKKEAKKEKVSWSMWLHSPFFSSFLSLRFYFIFYFLSGVGLCSWRCYNIVWDFFFGGGGEHTTGAKGDEQNGLWEAVYCVMHSF